MCICCILRLYKSYRRLYIYIYIYIFILHHAYLGPPLICISATPFLSFSLPSACALSLSLLTSSHHPLASLMASSRGAGLHVYIQSRLAARLRAQNKSPKQRTVSLRRLMSTRKVCHLKTRGQSVMRPLHSVSNGLCLS